MATASARAILNVLVPSYAPSKGYAPSLRATINATVTSYVSPIVSGLFTPSERAKINAVVPFYNTPKASVQVWDGITFIGGYVYIWNGTQLRSIDTP